MILNLKNKFLFNAYIMNIDELSDKLDEINDKLYNQKIDHNNLIKNLHERNVDDPILENYIKDNALGYPVTKLEKSESEECGWVRFYFIKNQGLIELNLLENLNVQNDNRYTNKAFTR